jgi:hypothetical protein
MSSWARTKYKTTNWSSYNDSLKQRGSLSIWFYPEMVWTPPPSGKRGRQQQFSDAAIQTCLTLKVLFGMPLWQTTGFAQSLLRLVGLDWAVPDFSTLCRRQRTLNVSLPYRGSKGPLNLLINSTGIKAQGEGEWNARKHGGPKRRIWRKIHIGIDEETLEVRAVEVTTNNRGDAPMLPELLNQISPDQVVDSVTADGAYDTRKCHEAIAARDANAVIPPRLRPFRAELIHWINSRPPFTPARMPSPGSRKAREPLPETKRSVRSDTWVVLCGDAGVDTTAEVASKRRCIV